MKRTHLAALLPALLLMLLVLGSCGGSSPTLTGEWKAELDLADTFNEAFANYSEGDANSVLLRSGSFPITLQANFREDGTYTMTLDRDSVDAALMQLRRDLSPAVEARIRGELQAAGSDMTVEEYLASSNLSLNDLMNDLISVGLSEDLAAELESQGTYTARDGVLRLVPDARSDGSVPDPMEDTYTLEGGLLTLTTEDDGFGPIKFHRVEL